MLIKVCGLRNSQNIKDVELLGVDLMGFIFYEKSPRFVSEKPDYLPQKAKKVGVFVNETTEKMLVTAEDFALDYLQLHGSETPEQCKELKAKGYKIIKAFSVSEPFHLDKTKAYDTICDYFVFDTPTAGFGGSGKSFSWEILANYKGKTPYLLSGGISLESLAKIKNFTHPALAGLDLNSGFENSPANKNTSLLKTFILNIKDYEQNK